MNASGCVIKIITQKKCLRLLLLMFEVIWVEKDAFFILRNRSWRNPEVLRNQDKNEAGEKL